MKKDKMIISTVLSAALLAMFLTALMLLEVEGYVTHGPDINHD